MRYPLALITLAATCSLGAAQVITPVRFAVAELDPCVTGEAMPTTRDVVWSVLSGQACLAPGIDPAGTTLAFGAPGDSSLAVYAVDIAAGGAEALNVAPGDQGEYYAVGLALTGGVGAVGPLDFGAGFGGGTPVPAGANSFSFATFTVDADDPERSRQIDLDPFGVAGSCGAVVEGGSRIDLTSFPFVIRAGTDPFAIGLTLEFTPLADAAIVREVIVPEGARVADGEYVSDLPAGYVSLAPAAQTSVEAFGALPVRLAEAAAESQAITLRKAGGSLVASSFVQLSSGQATNGEPHRVTLELDDVDVCIGTNELLLGEGAVLSLNGVDFDYGSITSCLGIGEGARVTVAPGTSQALGDGELGMTLWSGGGALAVERDAELSISGLVALGGLTFGQVATEVGDGLLEVAEGARVVVSAAARDYGAVFGELIPDSLAAGNGDARIVVRVAEGGSFDMSAAPASVQALFRVEGSSAAISPSPLEYYRLAANPVAAGGPIALLAEPGAAPLRLVELIDAAGRTLQRSTGKSLGTLSAPAVPGVVRLRLTDAEGRVGVLQLLVTR